jgi:hypothetical protein
LLIFLFSFLHYSLIFFWCDTFTRFSESYSFLFCKIFQHSLLTLRSHCLFSNILSTIFYSLEIHRKHCSFLIFYVIDVVIADNALNHFLEFRIFKFCCEIKSSKNQKFPQLVCLLSRISNCKCFCLDRLINLLCKCITELAIGLSFDSSELLVSDYQLLLHHCNLVAPFTAIIRRLKKESQSESHMSLHSRERFCQYLTWSKVYWQFVFEN